jgi:glycosyltransferase involved in cell wall biosynthesis
MKPLVTVICISYNHAAFVYDALCSIHDQSYTEIQLIVADDASTDQSQAEIQRFIEDHPHYTVISILNEQNTGNCVLFNKALSVAKGKYIIDLAADDWLYASCIERQVDCFESQPDHVGVVFTNVDLVDAQGKILKKHYPTHSAGLAKQKISQGEVYEQLVKKYFISPVGMIMRKDVLDELGGYDESLSYEDFDFWIRSSRICHYVYLDACLVAKRILPRSHSTKFAERNQHAMFLSTAKVCQKIAWLNKTEKERKALLRRIHYEIRQALKYRATAAIDVYIHLLKALKGDGVFIRLYTWYYSIPFIWRV